MSTFVKPLTCITAFFDGCGFANYQSSRSWSVSENAHSSWTTWYIWIKMHTCVFKHCPAKLWRCCWENLKRKILSKITISIFFHWKLCKSRSSITTLFWHDQIQIQIQTGVQQVYTVITEWVRLSIQFAVHTFHRPYIISAEIIRWRCMKSTWK